MKSLAHLKPRLSPSAIGCMLIALFAVALPLGLHGQTTLAPGNADPAFSNINNTEGSVIQVAAQSSGKIVALGSFTRQTTPTSFVRLNSDGTEDTTFARQGLSIPGGNATAFAVQPDGKIVYVGTGASDGNTTASVGRLTASGANDPSFASGTVPSNKISSFYSVALEAGGKIYVGGDFTSYNGQPAPGIVRLNSDGTLDPTFTLPTYDQSGFAFTRVLAVATEATGQVVVAGDVLYNGDDGQVSVAGAVTLNNDGSLDPFASPVILDKLTSTYHVPLVILNGGDVVLGGDFTTANGSAHPYLVRFDQFGAVTPDFKAVLDGRVIGIAAQRGNVGVLLVGGLFTNVSGTLRPRVALLDIASGNGVPNEFNPGTGPGGGGPVYTVALQADGNLLVGGSFAGFGTATRDNLVRLITDFEVEKTTIDAQGTSDLWLAGTAPNTTGSNGQDTLLNALPSQVSGLDVVGGQKLIIVSQNGFGGGVVNDPANPVSVDPDGGPFLGAAFAIHPAENGIAGLTAPYNALIGVFLDDTAPSAVDTPPAALDFSGAGVPDGINFVTIAPALRQPFFIGDGSAQDGASQRFVVPAGATRLYLGSLDQSDNENNTGSYLTQVFVDISGGGGTGPGGNLIVPGTANPYLAGLPDGATASGGDDTAPAESPVLVPGLTLHPNNPLNFSVAGSVSTDPAVGAFESPDGGDFYKHLEENFISPVVAPLNSLVGVFLSDTASDASGVHDIVRDFSDATNTNGGVNFLGYQPRLGEPFFIGDGKTSTGLVQNVFPPVGATRLYLGVLDGNDYFNNVGQFKVGVTQNAAIDTTDLHLGQSVTTPTDNGGAAALIGDRITYTFHVKNEGSRTFTNVVVKDVLPGVCEFVSASDGGTFKGGIVTWNLGTVAPTGTGAARDLTLVVKTFATGDSGQNVSAAQINQVINNLDYYLTGDGLPQAVQGLDLNNATTLKAPVSVAVTSNSASIHPGGTVDYAIDLTDNLAPTTANPKGKVKTTFTLTLPAGVKFVSAAFLDDNGVPVTTVSTDGGITFTSALGSFAFNGGGTATFTPTNLKANATAHLVLTVIVPYDVEPAAAVKLLAAKLTTNTTDGFGQNAYGVATPDTKLSAAAVTLLPKLSLTKTTVDPYSLAQLFLFDSKDANSLAKAFPAFPFYQADPNNPPQKLINPDALIDLGQFLNPYIGQDLETGVLTITAPDAKKAPVTYATFALAYGNDGNVDTDKIVINDPIPDGFAYDPAGLPTDPSINPIPAPFVLINGKAATTDNFQVRADGRALIFSLGKAKMGKSGLIIYQLRVTGTSLGQVVQVPRAGLSTDSLNATTYSDSGVGESLQIVGPQSYTLESQNNGNYTRVGDQVNFDLFYTNTGVAKYKDFLVECQVPAGVTFAGSAVLAANGHDVAAAGPAPDSSGRIVFHLGKLKPNGSGFVRVTYTLGAALRTANRPQVVNSWIASEADINDDFPQATHRILTRAVQARPGTRAATGTTGNPVAHGTTLVNDPSVPRLFIAKMAPLAVVPDKPYDYLVAVGNLSETVAGGDVTNTSQGIIATETLPPDVTFVSLTGNSNRSVTVKGNVVTYQLPAIGAHVTDIIKIRVKPNAGSTGKSLMATSQVDIPNGPLLSAKPTITRVVAASQIGLQAGSVAGDALTGSGFKGTALPNLGKQLDFSKNMVVCAGADFLYFNNGALLIPQGNGAATLFGDASSISYPDSTATGGVTVSANGGVVAVDASGVLSVHALADNAQRTVVGIAGLNCQEIINDLYTASPANLVRKSAAFPHNQGGLNLYGANGTSFLNNQPNSVPQTINRVMVLGVGGAVIPAGLANATLSKEGFLKTDHLITQDGGGLITQDGGGLVAQGGGNLITQDGGGLITQDGGGLITQDGGGLVAQGGGNLTASSGAELVAQGGGNLTPTPPGSTLVAQGGGNLAVAGSGLVAQGGGN